MTMAMFNDFGYFVFFFTLAAPALPWLFTRKRDAAAIWRATWITVTLLVLFNALHWWACDVVSCGQGAIGILAVSIIGVMSGIVTLAISAHLAKSRR